MMRTPLKVAVLLRPYRKFVAIAFAGALGQTAAELLQPWPLKIVFDHYFNSRPLPSWIARSGSTLSPGTPSVLWFALALVIAIACVIAAAAYAEDFFTPRIGHWVLHDLRRQLYWHIQRLSLAYHDSKRTGDLLNTLTADIETVQALIQSALVGFVINGLTLIGMIVIMFLMDWRFSLLALSVAPLLFAIVYKVTRKFRQASREVRRSEGKVASIAAEVLSSIRVVQAFSREDYEQTRFERENDQRVSAGIRAGTLQAMLRPAVEILVAAGTLLVIWYGARQVQAGNLTPGALLVFLAYLGGMYKPMRALSRMMDIAARAAVGLERIFAVLETEQLVRDLPGAVPAPKPLHTIELESVSFAYGTGKQILTDINFVVEPGQVIALVGPSGAGKTTVLGLIARFHEPSKGRILINGRDIHGYTLASLRSQISLVLQDTLLFHGTVYDNIAYGLPDATSEQVVAAARAANAAEFIERLEDGYNTVMGERGVRLSAGQRQRLAVARALIRNAPIVLLDEPTAGLDTISESLVMEGLGRLMAGRACLMVAHRLSTISRNALILVLQEGRIVERGMHRELLAAGGRYAELYNLHLRAGASDLAAREGATEMRLL